MTSGTQNEQIVKTSSINSSFPVLVPEEPALTCSDEDFEAFVDRLIKRDVETKLRSSEMQAKTIESGNPDDRSDATSSWLGGKGLADLGIESVTDSLEGSAMEFDGSGVIDSSDTLVVDSNSTEAPHKPTTAYVDALLTPKRKREDDDSEASPSMERKMRTENNDVAFRSTKSPIVDLFFEIEKRTSQTRVNDLLNASWEADPLITLKIIFLTRSIHLGKSEKETFYRCYQWLLRNHPKTALANLKWLNVEIIEKKATQDKEAKELTEKPIIISKNADEEPPDFSIEEHWLVKDGATHGYWKDLLNFLVVWVRGDFSWTALHDRPDRKSASKLSVDDARKRRHQLGVERHAKFVEKFDKDVLYRVLHLTVARMFATKLRHDLALLESKTPGALKKISLAGKWAPSLERFHDKYSLIASSIAEILCPRSDFDSAFDRTTYLKHAREKYRYSILSPLRKALKVVERDITAEALHNIDYARVPSLAMQRYQAVFATKDEARFNSYLERVAAGTARISGAIVNPAQLVKQVRNPCITRKNRTKRVLLMAAQQRVAEGQWNSIIQRLKDSGNLSDTIAIADVSGSMNGPRFSDGTCPMDSSIGLALLVAEVTKAPFGGVIITFSETPSIAQVGGPADKRSFVEKIAAISSLPWGFSTNFVSVFEDLILPRAIEHKVTPEDMVKRVIVFSDMHFNDAQIIDYERYSIVQTWSSSFEHIQAKFRQAGYEMPDLVFWNLAGGRAGDTGFGDSTAPKPVDSDEPGTALVGGYSQALLKVFMEGGSFDEAEVEEEKDSKSEEQNVKDEVISGSEDEETVKIDIEEKKEQTKDPLAIVKRAISHRAYQMFTVVD